VIGIGLITHSIMKSLLFSSILMVTLCVAVNINGDDLDAADVFALSFAALVAGWGLAAYGERRASAGPRNIITFPSRNGRSPMTRDDQDERASA
jgi:hypothetical protein